MSTINIKQEAGDQGANSATVVTGNDNQVEKNAGTGRTAWKSKPSSTKIAIWVAIIAAVSAIAVALIEKI